jgi:hypothetical protein
MKVLVAALMLSTGCSWMATSKPRPLRPGELPTCTTSRLAPGLDTYQAVGNGLVGVMALSAVGEETDSDLFAMIAATTLITGAVFAASAVHGFRVTRACREQHAAVTRSWVTPSLPFEPVEAEPVEIEREVDIKIRERIRVRPH